MASQGHSRLQLLISLWKDFNISMNLILLNYVFKGDTVAESAGSNFTPHTIAIQPGENIVQTICSFSQRASESICILSASGTVSSAEILRPGSCGGILRYEA
ncbi:UNVERIFIED_CONTAM: AT-hook motif nuclear-localized protein 7 [Sesamum latifolium]|uniref:AT-hook motif nuclear-localized protein n=1 Tax=Sesamum latifolium TaxID=2727402 RepID=A0AAW2Y4T8_9LAMI